MAKPNNGPLMQRCATVFNDNLKMLTKDLGVRFPNDPVVYRATSRIMMALSVLPMVIIESAGPYLYQYRAIIYNTEYAEAIKFFAANDFDKEVRRAKGADDKSMIEYIIVKTKDLIPILPENEKKQYMDIVIDLLDNYIEYLAEKENL